VVTHGGIISVFLALMNGESTANWRRWTVPNASLSEVLWFPDAGRGELLRHGEYAHLGPLEEPGEPWATSP
jgi:broad specificity phosphatase PhoE